MARTGCAEHPTARSTLRRTARYFSRFFFTIAGAPANLVFLHANAFDDIAALSQIEAVILRGELYDRATLDAVLDDLGS
jgi:hypothetical protein